MAEKKTTTLVGHNYTTPDLVAKVTGKAKYAEDYRVEGMLFAKLLVSPMPHARVSRLDTRAAEAIPGVKAVERALAVRDIGDEPLDAAPLVALHEPRLVQQRPHVGPPRALVQQVVALGDHQPVLGADGDRAGDGLLARTVELGGIHDVVRLAAQATQQGDVPRHVEGLGRPLAVPEPEPCELVVVQVEPVHRHHHRGRSQAGDQPRGQRRLAGPGRSADSQHRAPAGHQAMGPREQVLLEPGVGVGAHDAGRTTGLTVRASVRAAVRASRTWSRP